MSNLREISVDECRAVFGGNSDNVEPEITVSGRKLYYDSTLIWDFQQDIGFGSGAFGSTGNGGFGNLTLPAGWDLGWVDTNDDGVPNSPEIVVIATVPSDTGSWYGGGWIAGVFGASVSGATGQTNASAGVGLGGGYFIGYSSDDTTAQNNGDNTQLQYPYIAYALDFDPFTIGIGINAGIYLPIFEKHNTQ